MPGRPLATSESQRPLRQASAMRFFSSIQMRNAVMRQMLAHGNTRLPRAYHQGIDLCNLLCHICVLQARLSGLSAGIDRTQVK